MVGIDPRVEGRAMDQGVGVCFVDFSRDIHSKEAGKTSMNEVGFHNLSIINRTSAIIHRAFTTHRAACLSRVLLLVGVVDGSVLEDHDPRPCFSVLVYLL